MKVMKVMFLFLLLFLALLGLSAEGGIVVTNKDRGAETGAEYFFRAEERFENGDYASAAELFWMSLLFPSTSFNHSSLPLSRLILLFPFVLNP